MRMKKNLEDYLRCEIFCAKVGVENETDTWFKESILDAGIQRCLGACQLAELCGMNEKEVSKMYEQARAELEALE